MCPPTTSRPSYSHWALRLRSNRRWFNPPPGTHETSPTTKRERFPALVISVLDLLALNRQPVHQLRRRGLVHTFNLPQGDEAETPDADAHNDELAPQSEKSYDVQAGDHRPQAKASASTPQLSAVGSFDFTHLVVVPLSTDTMAPLKARELAKGSIVGCDVKQHRPQKQEQDLRKSEQRRTADSRRFRECAIRDVNPRPPERHNPGGVRKHALTTENRCKQADLDYLLFVCVRR